MEEIINKLINYHIKGVDIYTHGGSTWLIFTKTKQWVIELTDDKTLWYNYNFFSTIFSYASLSVIDNQQYITKWVEDNVIGGVRNNGSPDWTRHNIESDIEDTLENGVKHTEYGDWLDGDERLDEIVENGVKETNYDTDNYTDDVKEVIREGVKETKTPGKDGDILSTIEWMEENKSTSYTKMIDDVIDNGVKEIKTPNKDGDIQSTLEWMYKNNYQDDYNGSKMINYVIENGVKEVVSYDEHKRGPVNTFGYIDDIIKEGEKINGTYAGGQRQSEKCKSVVEYGTKNPTD